MVIFLIWIKYKSGGYISFTAIDHPYLFTIRLYIYMYTLIKLEYSRLHVYVCDMNNSVRIIKHFIHVSNVCYLLFQSIQCCNSFSDPWIPHVLKVGHHTTVSTLSLKSLRIGLFLNCNYIWGLYHLVNEEGLCSFQKHIISEELCYYSNEADSVAIV